MLPSCARLTRRRDFGLVVRQGLRTGRRTVVVHAVIGDAEAGPPRRQVGFVVSGAIGGAVVRHRVLRRLRHLVAARLAYLPLDCLLVVRALSPAATATSAELGSDLDAALRRLRLLRVEAA